MKKTKMTAGFTLVELIVVIAILGILAGVGTVGYSGYIKKANQAKDIQMIGQIKSALEVASYDSASGVIGGSYVTISSTTTDGSTDAVDEMLTDLYGSAEAVAALKLSADWSGEFDEAVMTDIADSYLESSFDGAEEGLLNDVQTLTNAFAAFTETLGVDIAGPNFQQFLTDTQVDTDSSQQVANSAALYVAKRSANIDADTFADEWASGSGSTTALAESGIMGSLAAQYARGEAMMAYFDKQRAGATTKLTIDGKEYDSYGAWFAEASKNVGKKDAAGNLNQNVVTQQLTDLQTKAISALTETGKNVNDYLGTEQAKTDAKAYLAALGAIRESEDVLTSNLNKTNLYNDGMALGMLESYKAMANGTVTPGSVTVVLGAVGEASVLPGGILG